MIADAQARVRQDSCAGDAPGEDGRVDQLDVRDYARFNNGAESIADGEFDDSGRRDF